jgi:probable HAF family extracellular repeat protein
VRKSRLTFLCFAISLAALPAGSQAASFTGLGFLPGGAVSYGQGVSADGSVVVGYSNTASTTSQAFRWTSGGGMVGLGFLQGGSASIAYGVSADGSVAVGWADVPSPQFGAVHQAFLWTAGGGMVNLGVLPGAFESDAFGVSADGSTVVGQSQGATNGSAFRWTAGGGMVSLGPQVANGASADGSVVVGTTLSVAWRWTAIGGMVNLGAGTANGVSADGSVVVGFSNPEAFRWTSGSGMVGLGLLPGASVSDALSVSGDGSVVVGYSGTPSAHQAIIWDATHGTRNLQQVLTTDYGLNLTGWTLEDANAISADGRTFVGDGFDPNHHVEAWIATIPEPATGLLVMAGVLGLAAARRRSVSA